MMKFIFSTLLVLGTTVVGDESDSHLRFLQDDDNTCAYFLDESSRASYQPAAYENQMPPRPICEDFSGTITFHRGNEYCCTFLTRLDILDGNSGGFSVEYVYPIRRGTPAEPNDTATCYAYMDALSDTICSPDQGDYISDGTFSVCEDSCNAVYEACDGYINFGDGVTDGKSFCEDAWNSKCDEDEYSSGYICGSGLTLNVASDSCISIVTPTEDTIAQYQQHSASEESWGCATRFFWVWITVAILIILCCCGLICCLCCRK